MVRRRIYLTVEIETPVRQAALMFAVKELGRKNPVSGSAGKRD